MAGIAAAVLNGDRPRGVQIQNYHPPRFNRDEPEETLLKDFVEGLSSSELPDFIERNFVVGEVPDLYNAIMMKHISVVLQRHPELTGRIPTATLSAVKAAEGLVSDAPTFETSPGPVEICFDNAAVCAHMFFNSPNTPMPTPDERRTTTAKELLSKVVAWLSDGGDQMPELFASFRDSDSPTKRQLATTIASAIIGNPESENKVASIAGFGRQLLTEIQGALGALGANAGFGDQRPQTSNLPRLLG